MADNRRAVSITAGVARSPNRAMPRAWRFRGRRFQQAHRGRGQRPFHESARGIEPLVDRAMTALEAAGAKPQVFGVPTVTDGIGMGTEAMKYSLVSREVIADCIETAVNGQAMDGVLVCGGCDKNMPGGYDGYRAHGTCPASTCTLAPSSLGKWEGSGPHHRQRLRGGRRLRRRQDEQGRFRRHREKGRPR